jgi:hypothetical protein
MKDFSRQFMTVSHLFSGYAECGDVKSLPLLDAVIKRRAGSEFTERMNRSQRKEAGVTFSNHQYNKRYRFLARMEAKLVSFEHELVKLDLERAAKSRLAFKIAEADAMASPATLAFLAYYTARCNRRSVFTVGQQERPYDVISDALFNACLSDPNTSWWAIVHVYPSQKVLERLTEGQRGSILGMYTTWLNLAADLLHALYQKSSINVDTMVVKRGDDSSTWNSTAGAWNKLRDGWINVVHDLGLSSILDGLCPGKVMRLMAGDVARWHSSTGGGLDPDTRVWASLPKPWEVFRSRVKCGVDDVLVACAAAGVDAEKSGWVKPRPHGVAQSTVTPELVHGVAVTNPFLASYLRNVGVYSGKGIKYANL